jgi:hypothetical protein
MALRQVRDYISQPLTHCWIPDNSVRFADRLCKNVFNFSGYVLCRILGWLLNNDLERLWKEIVVA